MKIQLMSMTDKSTSWNRKMRSNDVSKEIVEFNVGGSTYTTSKTTITSYPDSMLCRMISGNIPNATDNKQRIFIDRDGPLFRYILNFLRDKQLNLPENFTEYAQLKQEAEFFCIEPIVNQLDFLYHKKLKVAQNNTLCDSMSSLLTTSNEQSEEAPRHKELYFTVISKLYQGHLESLIGCIRVLTTFTSLDANSKRFISSLLDANNEGTSASKNLVNMIDTIICECKFMHEEKIIRCKPCGLNGNFIRFFIFSILDSEMFWIKCVDVKGHTTDPKLVNCCQQINRLAKKYGITSGYWEDMFYLSLDSGVPNRELLCSILSEKYKAKMLSSNVCDRHSTFEENSNINLVERWCIPDINAFEKSEQSE